MVEANAAKPDKDSRVRRIAAITVAGRSQPAHDETLASSGQLSHAFRTWGC